jgi:hypothetical protein
MTLGPSKQVVLAQMLDDSLAVMIAHLVRISLPCRVLCRR